MHILYYSLFMPDIMYFFAEIWGNKYATDIHCLVLLKKRAVRLLYGAKRLDNNFFFS